MNAYDPETYWSRVGSEIKKRPENDLAGDDNPILRYKRSKFLRKFLDTMTFDGRVVLELGCGPGGNLRHIAQHHRPRKLLGADISETMRELARHNLRDYRELVQLHKINGRSLPIADKSVDVSFTVTVLQHVTDEGMFADLVRELCRVTREEIVVMEDIGTTRSAGGQGSWVGRRVDVYQKAFSRHGFVSSDAEFLGTAVSRHWYYPFMVLHRRYVNQRHHEGEPMGRFVKRAMSAPLSITRYLDDIVPDRRDLARMVFRPQETTLSDPRPSSSSSSRTVVR